MPERETAAGAGGPDRQPRRRRRRGERATRRRRLWRPCARPASRPRRSRCAPDEFTRAAREAARSYDAVVAAGGDGTVSSVAAGLVGGETPLGVLPVGTLNHFAKRPRRAAGARRRGGGHRRRARPRTSTSARSNGRTFVNNSSIGAYPLAVAQRERLQERARPRQVGGDGARLAARAAAPAGDDACELRADGELRAVRTPIVFVGNNEYEVRGVPAGRRATRSTTACLCLYTVRVEAALPRAAGWPLRGAVRAPAGAEAFDARTLAGELEVSIGRPARCAVALDGEVLPLRHAAALPRPAACAAACCAADARDDG